MSLSQLQVLVLKDFITETVVRFAANPTNATYKGDFRTVSEEMLKTIEEPRRTAIKAGMLFCDKVEATFGTSALTREAQAIDDAQSAMARQAAAQAKPDAARAIAGMRQMIAQEVDNRKRGGGAKIDIDVSRQRLAELEGNFGAKYGQAALTSIKA